MERHVGASLTRLFVQDRLFVQKSRLHKKSHIIETFCAKPLLHKNHYRTQRVYDYDSGYATAEAGQEESVSRFRLSPQNYNGRV